MIRSFAHAYVECIGNCSRHSKRNIFIFEYKILSRIFNMFSNKNKNQNQTKLRFVNFNNALTNMALFINFCSNTILKCKSILV